MPKPSSIMGNQKGFTLMEILLAMVLLLIITMAVFPLLTITGKITHDNKARLIAQQLAQQELEQVLAQVTPANYLLNFHRAKNPFKPDIA